MLRKVIDTTLNTYNELSIQVGLNGFSFCICNRLTQGITALEKYPFNSRFNSINNLTDELNRYFDTIEKLQQSFKKVLLIHENELATFVPASLFEEKDAARYLAYNVKVLENDFVAYDYIPEHNLVNIYIPYAHVNNFIFERFGVFEYKHFSSILVESILARTPLQEEPCLFAHVQPEHFQLVAVANGKLLFYNHFMYAAQEDAMYYLLFTLEQLGLPPEKCSLVLLGTVSEKAAFYTWVRTYIGRVSFGTYSYPFSIDASVTTPPPHEEVILLNSF